MLSFIKRHQVIVAALILCLFSLYLVSGSKKGGGGAFIVKNVLSVASSPIRKSLIYVQTSVGNVWGGYIYLVGLKDENLALKKTLIATKEENNKLKEDIELTRRLKKLLKFKKNSPLKTVAAAVLGKSAYGLSGNWTRILVIDKGAKDGLKKDMPVMSPEGTLGRIIHAEPGTSTVLLLTDPRSNIDVIISRTRTKGVLEGGSGETGLTLKYIRELDDVKTGDRVITSGLSNIFPKGLVIVKVSRAERGSDNFFKYIELRPSVEINKIEEVMVVTGGGVRVRSSVKIGTPDAAKRTRVTSEVVE